MSMSARHVAYVSALTSCPYTSRRPWGLRLRRYSSDTDSMPPVPQAGSSIVLTIPGLVSRSSSSTNRRLTMSRITSRGVKCSPAVSFDNSEKRRINSS